MRLCTVTHIININTSNIYFITAVGSIEATIGNILTKVYKGVLLIDYSSLE